MKISPFLFCVPVWPFVIMNKMSYSIPVNVAIILSFIIFLLYLAGLHNVFTSYEHNDCEMTFMFQYPQFVEISLPTEVQKKFPKYSLYGYGEGRFTEKLRKMNFKGIPVLFIPGSSGSYKQGRSLASVSLRKSLNSRTPFHFNYFMIDFNEEQSAFYGGVLKDQTKFVVKCIEKILTLYKNNEGVQKSDSVILIGHSMGGILSKGVFLDPDFKPETVSVIISLASPHKYPLVQPDSFIASYYRELNNFWTNKEKSNQTFSISIGGGPKDILIHSDVVVDPCGSINVVTTAVPGVWLTNDHLSIMWCKQLVITIIRALFDSVDISTKAITSDKDFIMKVFHYHFVKRSAGKKFSSSMTSRFSSFEKTLNWFENLQRQFTVTESKGLNVNHYVMIRLFSDERNEAAFIEAFNVNVRDWLYVCSADVVYNSIRMCDSGENISNMTEIAPTDLNLQLKRKFVHLNLLELKAKSFTHVIVRLPPSNSYMSINVDIYNKQDRTINFQVPKYYSLSSHTIIEKTQDNFAYYSIVLVGFEFIWQSFILKLKPLSCKSEKNQGLVNFVTPWSVEDQYFTFREKNLLKMQLNLITPKPRNFTPAAYPKILLHLDPTCTYQLTIEASVLGMFAQGARYYSVLLPAFIAAVVLLTLRQQMKQLDDKKCVLLHCALCDAVRPYYVVFQASVFGSKLLGLGIFLSVFPQPDFATLQEHNLDSFFLTILLLAVAIVVVYSLGAAIYFMIILSGQAAQKLALRFIGKAISGIFNLSEWVIATLHQLPFFVSILLISLSVSTTGALGLWLGTFFYFLKLCKMYEDYLEDWFHFSLKYLAKTLKDYIVRKFSKNSQKLVKDEKKSETSETISKEIEKPESDTKAVDILSDTDKSETDLLAAIHFHVSVFMVWLLAAALYIPSLNHWVKNYYYSASLKNDPALIPSIIISACGSILWQSDVPKPYKKLSKITSVSLFVLVIISIIYASLSLYRLGYILSASLSVVALNQIAAKYF